MRNLAIIPARSGSKGLKDKNIRKLVGIPLVGYTIKAALDAQIFDTVMLSTDAEEYAEIGRAYGAEVPFLRSEYTSLDTASSWDVVKEVVHQYRKLGYEFDSIAMLQPTSPLRNAEDIIRAYNLFCEKKANAVISVCEAEHSPLWSNVLTPDLAMKHFAETDHPTSYRQELGTFYRLNGAIYIVNHAVLEDVDGMYQNQCYAYIMEQCHSIDIDSELDFIIAEAVMRAKY